MEQCYFDGESLILGVYLYDEAIRDAVLLYNSSARACSPESGDQVWLVFAYITNKAKYFTGKGAVV